VRLRALMLKEWRVLLRDRHALAVLFIMPTLFLLLMAMAMANINLDRPPQVELQLKISRDSDSARFFEQALIAQLPLRALSVERADGASAAADADLPAAGDEAMRLSLPDDFDERLLQSPPASLQLVAPAHSGQAQREAMRSATQIAMAQTRLMASLVDSGELDADSPLDERLTLIRQRTDNPLDERVELASGDLARSANATQHNVPAWLIFGMFFVMLPMANSFQREQQNGTLLRLRCLGIGLLPMALGKLPAYLLINLLQFCLLLGIGVWGLPLLGLPALELTGAALGYPLLALCLALATCSLGLAIAAIARSTEQALLLSGGLNIILAALGGIMVPKYVMPDAMRQLAELSPMSWALDGFLSLLVSQGGLAEVAPYCLRLLLFAVVCAGIGLALFHRRLRETQWTTLY
jgi:ABC-2 type transport system permease protein